MLHCEFMSTRVNGEQARAVGDVTRAHRSRMIAALLPGVTLCVLATAIAVTVNYFLPTISPLLIAIVLGAILTNAVRIPEHIQPGLQFSAKRLLRVGVALLGLQLMLRNIVDLGWGMIVVVIAIVFLGIAGTMFAGKLLGLSWTQRVLIACGFSICGAAAVAAVDGVIDAGEQEVVAAVALVILFGTLMIPAIPLLSHAFGLSGRTAGLWAGGSIHEVAQVVAASSAIGGAALGAAVVVKLARVLMLAPVMLILSVRQRNRLGADVEVKRPPLVPLFVVAFVVCVLLRSSGLLPGVILDDAKTVQSVLLTAAMFALGCGVRASTIAKVGARPLVLAVASTVWVATIALAGVLIAS